MPSSGFKTCALRSEEHTSELQSHDNLVCRLLLIKTNGTVSASAAHDPCIGLAQRGSPSYVPSIEVGQHACRLSHSRVVFFFSEWGASGTPAVPPPVPFQL